MNKADNTVTHKGKFMIVINNNNPYSPSIWGMSVESDAVEGSMTLHTCGHMSNRIDEEDITPYAKVYINKSILPDGGTITGVVTGTIIDKYVIVGDGSIDITAPLASNNIGCKRPTTKHSCSIQVIPLDCLTTKTTYKAGYMKVI